MIVVARFTEPDEFLDELRIAQGRSAHAVEGGVVRVTKLARPAGPNGVLTRITVNAGAIVHGRLVLLERYVGDLWGGPGDADVQQRATAIVAEIDEHAPGYGLDVRGGMFEARELQTLATAPPTVRDEVPS